MKPTKVAALVALATLVVLGVALVFAGITASQPGPVDPHVHSAVYHPSPAPVRAV